MNKRIKQTSPCTRDSLIYDDDELIEPRWYGEAFGIKFSIWSFVDVRFKKHRTFSLARLRWKDIGKAIMSYEKNGNCPKVAHQLHRMSDASNIYNLCFRKFMQRRKEYREDPVSDVRSIVKRELENKTLSIYTERRVQRWHDYQRKEMELLFGKPRSLISSKEKRDFLFGNESLSYN